VIFEYAQVYPPGTFVTAMAPQVEKVIVPWGWKRLLLNGAIVYFRWEVLTYVGSGGRERTPPPP